jgi:hypothetical protein
VRHLPTCPHSPPDCQIFSALLRPPNACLYGSNGIISSQVTAIQAKRVCHPTAIRFHYGVFLGSRLLAHLPSSFSCLFFPKKSVGLLFPARSLFLRFPRKTSSFVLRSVSCLVVFFSLHAVCHGTGHAKGPDARAISGRPGQLRP